MLGSTHAGATTRAGRRALRVTIALFIPCLTDQFQPRVAIACTLVLEHFGHRVVFPQAQTCCGQPMHNAGYEHEAQVLAARMIDVFAPFEVVVTPSASCAAMVREHMQKLFPRDAAKAAAASSLASRTVEFVEYLERHHRRDIAEAGGRAELRWPASAAYHPSCHMRSLGTWTPQPALLESVNGLDVRPLDRPEQCCGFGGLFALKQAGVSAEMALDKARAARATGATHLVCNDAGCAMNIAGACRRAGVDVQSISTAEILAEALGLLPRETAKGAGA